MDIFFLDIDKFCKLSVHQLINERLYICKPHRYTISCLFQQFPNSLQAGEIIHLGIIGINTLGLTTEIVRSEFHRVNNGHSGTSGSLVLVRHSCQAAYCSMECTCAASGQVKMKQVIIETKRTNFNHLFTQYSDNLQDHCDQVKIEKRKT